MSRLFDIVMGIQIGKMMERQRREQLLRQPIKETPDPVTSENAAPAAEGPMMKVEMREIDHTTRAAERVRQFNQELYRRHEELNRIINES